MAAPAAIPNRTDLLSGHARLKPTTIAATIASPAPTPLACANRNSGEPLAVPSCGEQSALRPQRHHHGLRYPALDEFVCRRPTGRTPCREDAQRIHIVHARWASGETRRS